MLSGAREEISSARKPKQLKETRSENNKKEPVNLDELRNEDDDLSDLISAQGDSLRLPPTSVNPQVAVGIMSGALTKEGHIRQNWKLRWFVLESNALSYYKTHLETKPTGVISLGKLSITPFFPELLDHSTRVFEDNSRGKPFCFRISCEGRKSFFLCARDDKDRQAWIRSINGVIKKERKIKEKHSFVCFRNNPYREQIEVFRRPRPTFLSGVFQPKKINSVGEENHSKICLINLEVNPWKSTPKPSKGIALLLNVNYIVGYGIIKKLISEGWHSRVAMRVDDFTPASQEDCEKFLSMGAEVLTLDFEKLGNLFEGVSKVFLFNELGVVENIIKETEMLLNAANTYKIKHIIKSSYMGCEKWHRYSESMITKSGIDFTILHMNSPMQNFLIDGIKTSGIFCMPIRDSTAVSWVDSRDISESIANVITSQGSVHRGKIYFLTGPQSLTCQEISVSLSTAAKKPVNYNRLTEEEAINDMRDFGDMPQWLIDAHIELFRAQDQGWTSVVSPDLKEILQRNPKNFDEFLQDNITTFREEYLNYFDPNSEELGSLYNQFNRMHSGPGDCQKEEKPKIYDGSICFKKFVAAMGTILGEFELAKALWRGFDRKRDDKLMFSEYACGIGKLLKGNVREKFEFAFKMFSEDRSSITEEQFINACDALHRFSDLNLHLPDDRVEYCRTLYKTFLIELSTKATFEAYINGVVADQKMKELLGTAVSESRWSLSKQRRGTISFGHQSWDFAEAMLLGIRHSLQVIATQGRQKVESSDFETKVDFTIFRETTTLPFTDFAPMVFHCIRRAFGIRTKDYMVHNYLLLKPQISLSPERLFGALEEVISAGRSGSFLYKTSDHKYLLKTIPNDEAMTLLKILPDYYEYLTNNTSSLLVKFFGFHKIFFQKKETYFVVMQNILTTDLEVNETYDLKGSTVGRLVEVRGSTEYASKTLKDVNFNQFNRKINLVSKKKKFLEQAEKDCRFLEERNICDYSLLAGFHFTARQKYPMLISSRKSVSIWQRDSGGICSENLLLKEVYFLGIVDILCQYDLKKKGEHALKSIIYTSSEISAIPPTPYRERFVRYLDTIIE